MSGKSGKKPTPGRKKAKPTAKAKAPSKRNSKAKPQPPPAPKLADKKMVVEERRVKTDWPAVAARYIRGIAPSPESGETQIHWPNLIEVADHFRLSIRNVEEHCSKEGWVAAREAFQDSLQKEEERLLIREQARLRTRGTMRFLRTSLKVQEQADRSVDLPLLPADLQKVAGALRTSQQVFEVSLGRGADGPAAVVDWTTFSKKPEPAVIDVFAEEDKADATP